MPDSDITRLAKPATAESTTVSEYPLRRLYFYLTEGCNLACRHCWLAPKYDADGTKYGSLPVEAFKTIIGEAKPLGLHAVKLTGGEPLLHPKIGDLLGTVREEDLSLAVETNGVLITPELARAIAECKDAFVSVSLDGADAGTHEWVRRVPGSFEKALNGVRCLVKAGLRPQLIMTLMRRNAGQMEALVRLAEGEGCESVKFNLAQPTERGSQLAEGGEALTVGEMIELGRYAEGPLAEGTDLRIVYDHPLAFRPLHRIARGNNGVCGILGILGVLWDGQYALCGIGSSVPELCFGVVGQDHLADVWTGHPRLVEIREGLPDRLEGVCSRCLMRRRCLGSCLAQNYYRHGGLWAGHWFCAEAHEKRLFPASRTRL
jgi:SynChlorMet cassette radical SAM/SPASM protein ScmF